MEEKALRLVNLRLRQGRLGDHNKLLEVVQKDLFDVNSNE